MALLSRARMERPSHAMLFALSEHTVSYTIISMAIYATAPERLHRAWAGIMDREDKRAWLTHGVADISFKPIMIENTRANRQSSFS